MQLKQIWKRAVSTALGVTLAASAVVTVSAKEFSDVQEGQWYYSVINKWAGSPFNVLNGSDGLFNPNNGMTVAEFASVLTNTFGYVDKASVPAAYLGKWYSDNYAKAISAGAINNGTDPEKVITRQEAISAMAKAFGISPASGRTTYEDDADIARGNVGYVKAFQNAGYISTTVPGQLVFAPTSNLTRAEVLAILNKLLAGITDNSVSNQSYDGSLIVRSAGVTLKNVTVDGNLIIAQGVGEGDVTLDGVTVTGKTIVLGGGENSIYIKGSSKMSVVEVKKANRPVRVVVNGDASATVTVTVTVNVVLTVTGAVKAVDVSANSKLTLTEAKVDTVKLIGASAILQIAKSSTIKILSVTAAKTNIKVDATSKVEELDNDAANTVVVAEPGTIAKVVSGKNAVGADIDAIGAVAENTDGSTSVITPVPLPPETVTDTGTPSSSEPTSSGGSASTVGDGYTKLTEGTQYTVATDTLSGGGSTVTFFIVKLTNVTATNVVFYVNGETRTPNLINGEYRLAVDGSYSKSQFSVGIR